MNRRDPSTQILPPFSFSFSPGDLKPRLPNHPTKLLLRRELRNALYQIPVTIPDRPATTCPISGIAPKLHRLYTASSTGIGDGAEFEAREDTAGFQDAECFAERLGFVGEVADAEGDGVEIH